MANTSQNRIVILFITILAIVCVILSIVLGLALPVNVPAKRTGDPVLDRVLKLLTENPLIDGHNDLPLNYWESYGLAVDKVDLNLDVPWKLNQTNIPLLREGKVGAQFWSNYNGCKEHMGKDSVRRTLEQMDIIHRFVAKYPDVFELVNSAKGITDAFSRGKIASLIGIEGGHSIDSSLSTLRMFYNLGTRYMTLTHSCNTPWADSSTADEPGNQAQFPGVGLSEFGKIVVQEMNRIGMLVDMSHVSEATMRTVLSISKAPIIFSHSGARALCDIPRNVKDDVLEMTAKNGGIVMAVFYTTFVACGPRYPGATEANVSMVADHIEHIKNIAGIDHVGIGADYDGASKFPIGLENVSKYPNLFVELVNRGWSDEDMTKLAGGNLLRVFSEVEQIRDKMVQDNVRPYDELVPNSDLKNNTCRPPWISHLPEE